VTKGSMNAGQIWISAIVWGILINSNLIVKGRNAPLWVVLLHIVIFRDVTPVLRIYYIR